MRYRSGKLTRSAGLLTLFAIAALVVGCAHLDEITPISPSPVGQRPTDFGLGPGVRPLSSGPGDKGSPGWSPSGERLAFVVDGYVVEKRTNESKARRQTTQDFGAKSVAWMASGERLTILAQGSSPSDDPLQSVYRADLDDSLSVNKMASEVLAMSPITGDDGLLVASQTSPSSSQLAVIEPNGSIRAYGDVIEGDITAISVVPDGDRAIVAVRRLDPEQNFEILSFSFAENRFRTITSLRQDLQIFGAPQWTENGIYYVAGEETVSSKEVSPDYNLYRLAPGSNRPDLAPGVGEDFVASSLKRNSKGDLLAVVGRRNSSSPANLYVLNPDVGEFVAATTNENMEIKTEAKDLAWSSDDRRVAIVARTMISEPRVYDVQVDTLVSDFYNVYEVPIDKIAGEDPA